MKGGNKDNRKNEMRKAEGKFNRNGKGLEQLPTFILALYCHSFPAQSLSILAVHPIYPRKLSW